MAAALAAGGEPSSPGGSGGELPSPALAAMEPSPLAQGSPSRALGGLAAPESALVLAGGSEVDMMARFEALSNLFKSEVGALMAGKETAREDIDKVEERNRALEEELETLRAQARTAVGAIHRFVAENQQSHLEQLFGLEEDPCHVEGAEARLCSVVERFIEVNAEKVRPELEEARREIDELRGCTERDRAELARLRTELAEARKLKSQEERELLEFRSLREKESEVQSAKIVQQQLTARLEEAQSQSRQAEARAVQVQAMLKEKSNKIVDLLKQLEQQGEKTRLLADENNSLRLELGRDADYLTVAQAPADPFSSTCEAGALSQDLQDEDRRLEEDLLAQCTKFPGLQCSSGYCRLWCQLQISRVGGVYRSFLHRFQDYRASFPEGVQVEFVSQAQGADSEWAQQEELMREADAGFQETEQSHTRRWEEHRLKLAGERDAKVKQLLEQADKAQTKAEQQLLLQQAKLFGSRVDAQIERAWEEQKKERDLRWSEHQQQKHETRQKLKDESLMAQQRVEDRASLSGRFLDLAGSRLAAVEDAWLRNSDKAAAISTLSLRGGDLPAFLHAAIGSDREVPKVPARGAQHAGISLVVDTVEEVLKLRADARRTLRRELEDQSLQQLRACSDRFLQREASQQKPARAGERENEETAVEYSQAVSILSLLRVRQHRQLGDALKRQFYDYLLVLRVCTLAATWLLPTSAAEALGKGIGAIPVPGGGDGTVAAVRDLPPLPPEMEACRVKRKVASGELSPAGVAAAAVSCAAPDAGEDAGDGSQRAAGGDDAELQEDLGDDSAEGRILYTSLCRRLLDRALSVMDGQHREELTGLKRACAVEQRTALQTLCQLEADQVAQAVKQDIDEFELQMTARLLADSERQASEERKQIARQVGEEVELHVTTYRRQIDEEEQASVRERRKWLTERLVVLQANGSACPGDRTVLQRLRQELRACESKIELYDNGLVKGAVAAPDHPSAPVARPTSARGSRPPSASGGRRVSASQTPQASPTQTQEQQQLQQQQVQLQMQRQLQEQMQLQMMQMQHQLLQQHWPTPVTPGQGRPQVPSLVAAGGDCQRPPERAGSVPPSPQSPAFATPSATTVQVPSRGPHPPLPQFGREGKSPEFGIRPGEPLYEWPFEGVVEDAGRRQRPPSFSPSRSPSPPRSRGLSPSRKLSGTRSASPRSDSAKPRLKPLDCLAPLKSAPKPLAQDPVTSLGNRGAPAAGEYFHGTGGGLLPTAAPAQVLDSGGPKPQLRTRGAAAGMPPLLPPVQTPRG